MTVFAGLGVGRNQTPVWIVYAAGTIVWRQMDDTHPGNARQGRARCLIPGIDGAISLTAGGMWHGFDS